MSMEKKIAIIAIGAAAVLGGAFGYGVTKFVGHDHHESRVSRAEASDGRDGDFRGEGRGENRGRYEDGNGRGNDSNTCNCGNNDAKQGFSMGQQGMMPPQMNQPMNQQQNGCVMQQPAPAPAQQSAQKAVNGGQSSTAK
jgi:hypothetical protein